MKPSKAASILAKIREEEENDIENDQEVTKQEIDDMEPKELVEFIKENNWSQEPELMKEAVKAIGKLSESDDEEAKLMMEALDDASSEFDVEKMKEKKANK
jgi:hypothetical protein